MLRVESLKKVFRSGESDLVLFENLSFQVRKGEMLAIVGESGAGKSTLLHIVGALDSASEGDVYCARLQVNSLPDDQAAEFRNRQIGFVWQFHYLLPAGSKWREKLRTGFARWDWSSAPITVPENFPVESSSESLWPVRSSLDPNFCWRMSPLVISTAAQPSRFSN